MIIDFSPRFEKRYKKLDKKLKLLVKERLAIFSRDPFDLRLKTHKLHGLFKDKWAFSIDRKNRVIFSFKKDDHVELHTVGDHGIYR